MGVSVAAAVVVVVVANWGVGRYEGNSEGSGSCFGIGMWICFGDDEEDGENDWEGKEEAPDRIV